MDQRAYWRKVSKDRYDARMIAAMRLLGGRCVECGAEENLHFHHKDPSTKAFEISTGHARPWVVVLEEIGKCELRCSKHHIEIHGAVHGTISRYRHHRCRCEPCRAAWSLKCKEWKKK